MEGIACSPEVASVMFHKIDRCALFVADTTLVGSIHAGLPDDPPKRVPTPNVSLITISTIKNPTNRGEQLDTVFVTNAVARLLHLRAQMKRPPVIRPSRKPVITIERLSIPRVN
jgi:hypothetical protein